MSTEKALETFNVVVGHVEKEKKVVGGFFLGKERAKTADRKLGIFV